MGRHATLVKRQDELDADAWFRGYFPASKAPRWDGVTWRRNFRELWLRDAAVFCLGDVAGKDILDVACGGGLYMVVLAKLRARVCGQDISPDAVAEAEKTLARHSVAGVVKVGNATRLLFEDRSFDAVFSGDFIEHIALAEKRLFIAEVFRVLKPGGVFVIKTPNLTYLRTSVRLERLLALCHGRSPRSIHIAHTRNNPDTQHYGLITHARLRALLLERMFHSMEFTREPLSREHIPEWLRSSLAELPLLWRVFNEQIIVRARKPLFYGLFP